jgi:hypothetical protein
MLIELPQETAATLLEELPYALKLRVLIIADVPKWARAIDCLREWVLVQDLVHWVEGFPETLGSAIYHLINAAGHGFAIHHEGLPLNDAILKVSNAPERIEMARTVLMLVLHIPKPLRLISLVHLPQILYSYHLCYFASLKWMDNLPVSILELVLAESDLP